MDRRSFLSAAGAASLLSAGARAQSTGAERPPNILYLLFDKCRRDAFNCYGLRETSTPNIDRLASEGVRFNNCYVPQALCGPARASILTGSYPHWHGLRRNVYPVKPSTLPSNYQEAIPDPWRDTRFNLIDNWAFYLNAGGYRTGHIGKWHLGPLNPGFFDYWKGFNSMLRHWVGEPYNSRYRPDIHTDQGIRFIEEGQGSEEPWMLYQAYYTPHEPLDPPKQFLEPYQDEEHPGYWGNVSALDWNVGRILEALERTGQLDNTFIILGTEHGRTWRDRPGTAEGMCIAYDEVARVPLILRYPKRLPQGKVWESGVSLVDLMPTIMDAAGVDPLVGTVEVEARRPFLHGRSLFKALDGPDRWEQPVVIQNLPQAAIDGSFYEERAIRWERWKLILRRFDNRPELRPGELYDIEADPEEDRNVYAARPEIVRDMAHRLSAFGERTEDALSVRLGRWAMG